ncbi:MAG: hypothetical protein LKI53_04715 [Bacteroidales bacterium]|jgi:hypothetical protein|nr:hypothetical protein [Bacteroidales bacterium]
MKKTIPIIAQSVAAGVFLVSHFFLSKDNRFAEISNQYNLYLTILLLIIAANILYFKVIDNNEILKLLKKSTNHIYKFQDGQILLKELYKTLERNKNQIVAVYSTAIQSKIDVLNEYNSYSQDIFKIFKKLEKKPKLRFFYQIPSEIHIKTDTNAQNYFYDISFGSLYKKLANYYNSNNDDIEFIFNNSKLNFPFINFTLVEYSEKNKFEVFYGWYATQAPILLDMDFPETFINTSQYDVCDTYLSIWKILVSISENNDNKLVKFKKLKNKEYYIEKFKELGNETR